MLARKPAEVPLRERRGFFAPCSRFPPHPTMPSPRRSPREAPIVEAGELADRSVRTGPCCRDRRGPWRRRDAGGGLDGAPVCDCARAHCRPPRRRGAVGRGAARRASPRERSRPAVGGEPRPLAAARNTLRRGLGAAGRRALSRPRRRARARRGGEPGEVARARHRQPRVPHAAERHPRPDRAPARRRADARPGDLCARRPILRRGAARAGRRHARLRQDRSRPPRSPSRADRGRGAAPGDRRAARRARPRQGHRHRRRHRSVGARRRARRPDAPPPGAPQPRRQRRQVHRDRRRHPLGIDAARKRAVGASSSPSPTAARASRRRRPSASSASSSRSTARSPAVTAAPASASPSRGGSSAPWAATSGSRPAPHGGSVFASPSISSVPSRRRSAPAALRDRRVLILAPRGAEPPVLARMLADAGASARVTGTAVEAAGLAGAAAAAALPYEAVLVDQRLLTDAAVLPRLREAAGARIPAVVLIEPARRGEIERLRDDRLRRLSRPAGAALLAPSHRRRGDRRNRRLSRRSRAMQGRRVPRRRHVRR